MVSKKKFTLFVLMMLMIFCATVAMAAPRHRGPSHVRSDRFGHGPENSVYFFPQDMDIYSDMFRFNAWGLMKYRLWGDAFQFLFVGHNLNSRTGYALVYYPEGADMVVLGSGTTNRGGQLNLQARVDICTLPSTMDANYFFGARLMLVPSASVAPDESILMAPGSSENLISYNPIRFTNTDTDGCVDEDPVPPPEDPVPPPPEDPVPPPPEDPVPPPPED